jgi:hypothetical protein
MQRILMVVGMIFLVLVLIGSCDMHLTTARGKGGIPEAQQHGRSASP